MTDERKPEFVTVVELSRWFGITPRRVQSLVTDGHLTKPEAGKYDLKESVRQYIEFLRKSGRGGGVKLVDEKTRLTTAQADREELELEEMKGELVSASTVEKAWGAEFAAIRQSLLSMPSKAAPVVAQMESVGEVKAFLDELIHDTLAGLSGGRKGGPQQNPAKRARKARTSSKTQGKRVGGREAVSQPGVVGGAGEVVNQTS